MTIRTACAAAALATSFAFLPAGAFAQDRAPTADETAQISAALTAKGYTSWGKIEMDDGKWEVDNAVGADGKRYDVDLDTSFAITKAEVDN